MAWIKQIGIEEAQGKLRKLYDRIVGRTKGSVANILMVHSLNPDAMEAHLNLYETIMFGESGLSRGQREMIAVVVSSTNSCHYWTTHHGEALRFATEKNEIARQLAEDFTKADIPKQEKLMLYYVQKLTKEPYNIKENDVKALKKVGFTDRDIFDINQVTAYFNYVNRIADGLGIALEW
jgi:uncharacterized peroxidase-related enzyme